MNAMTKFSSMWTLVQFRCPNDLPDAKRAANKFRKAVARHTTNLPYRNGEGMALCLRDRDRLEAELTAILPPDSELRLMAVTDAQIGGTRIRWGKVRHADGTVKN